MAFSMFSGLSPKIVFIYGGSRVHGQILSDTFGSFEIELLYFLCPGFEGNLFLVRNV